MFILTLVPIDCVGAHAGGPSGKISTLSSEDGIPVDRAYLAGNLEARRQLQPQIDDLTGSIVRMRTDVDQATRQRDDALAQAERLGSELADVQKTNHEQAAVIAERDAALALSTQAVEQLT